MMMAFREGFYHIIMILSSIERGIIWMVALTLGSFTAFSSKKTDPFHFHQLRQISPEQALSLDKVGLE